MSSTEISREAPVLRGFFDSIAGRYDFLNHLLSFRLDESWRRRSRNLLLEGGRGAGAVLDLGTGTGKFLRLFWEVGLGRERLVGLDFSPGMLERARREIPAEADLVQADFQALPFQDEYFDLVISAFALRSVRDMPGFLSNVRRMLRKGGRAALLCLTRPQSRLWNALYFPYLRFYLPAVGGAVSGNRRAYEFLSGSILTFQDPEQTASMMAEAGFSDAAVHRFSWGAATLILGCKA